MSLYSGSPFALVIDLNAYTWSIGGITESVYFPQCHSIPHSSFAYMLPKACVTWLDLLAVQLICIVIRIYKGFVRASHQSLAEFECSCQLLFCI